MKLPVQATNISSPSSITLQDGWKLFPIPDKSADTIVSMFINHYPSSTLVCPRFILSDNGTEFKNDLTDQVLQQLCIDCIFSAPYHPQSNGKLEVFHKYLKPTLKKLCWKGSIKLGQIQQSSSCTSYRVTPNLATAETPFFLVCGRDPNLPLHQLLELMQQIPRWPSIWLTEPGSTSCSPSHCKENTRWKPLQDCPENHG